MYLICYLSASGFQIRRFLKFISYIALYIHMIPWGVASLEPRGLIGRIYVGDHYTLLHTQYISCGAHGFREEDFLSFSHYKSMTANDPQGMASLNPRGLIGRIYVVDHYTLLHTKYISSGPHGFQEEDFLSFSHYKCMGANDPSGVWPIWTQGHGWQDLCRRPLNIASYLIY